MKGIYKITTPSNNIYIGQSVNIKKRFADHRWPNKKSISLISRSVKKYGYDKHIFEVVHELPIDVNKSVLSVYESLYMDLYRSCGICILNISDAKDSNYGYKKSAETIQKHREKITGRPSHMKGKTHTEDVKAIIKEKRALQVNVKGIKKGNIPWNKGMKGVYNIKGHPVPDEQKEKIRQSLMGRKLTAETIAKRTASVKARTERKRQWSDEARLRQSQRYLGKKRSGNTAPHIT